MTPHWTDRLSEYLDGDLAPAERRQMEEHLDQCAECTAVLAELGAVVEHAATLEHEPPAVDLWPAIRARLTPRRRSWLEQVTGWFSSGAPRFSFTLPQIAGAAAALVVLTGGAMWFAMSEHPARRPASVPSSAQNETMPAHFDEAGYSAAVEELERTLRANRAELDTSTVRVLEQNLAVIDRAVEEARRALSTDPSSTYLNGHLADQLRRKYRLLQRASEVIAAHS